MSEDNLFDFSDDLEEKFAKAEVKKPGYEEIPDGTYQVKVEKAYVEKGKLPENRVVKTAFRILNGDFTNKLLFKSYYMHTEFAPTQLKSDLATMGLKVESLKNELKDALPQMLDKKLEVRKKKPNKVNEDFPNSYNVFIQGLLETVTDNTLTEVDDGVKF